MDTDTAPVEGQGQESEGGSIFDPYLQSVPEGWDSAPQGSPRDIVSNYLKDAEKNVNSKLQEAADLQKRFGDYKDIDLSVTSPQQLTQVLDFVQQVGASPEAYQEWLRSEAEAAGFFNQEPEQEGPADGEDLETYVQSRIESALNPIQQQLGQYGEQFQANEQAQAQAQMEGHIESTLAGLEKQAGVELTEQQQEAVLALGEQVETNDWVEQGYQKFTELTGQAQASFVAGKQNQPAPALRTGGQAAPEKPRAFGDANLREAALAMAENMM